MANPVAASDFVQAKSILSSVNIETGTQIDTLQLRYPRIIHAEFMTHRAFSRNASSSRAIPTSVITVRDENIFVPRFRKNKAGMQPGDFLSPEEQAQAESIWHMMAKLVTDGCRMLADKDGLNIHKQWTNRPLEWFGFIDVVVTSTDWRNFDALRDHDAAQDEIRDLCVAMKLAREATNVQVLRPGEWHLPYVTLDDFDWIDFNLDPKRPDLHPKVYEEIIPIFRESPLYYDIRGFDMRTAASLVTSAARACRVSFSKHDGFHSTFAEDVARFLKLVPANNPVHASPLEHQATPLSDWSPWFRGNFRDFAQFRKFLPNEAVHG